MRGEYNIDFPEYYTEIGMKDYLYDAFISYRHIKLDKSIAIRLQRLLENYKPPRSGSYINTNRIKKVFRDESELPTSGDLGADIKKALEQSAFLIVICSEETMKSKWCMQEIDYFKQLNHDKIGNILVLLVSGDPHEVFPKSLCYETRTIELDSGNTVSQIVEVEPLAANVTSKSDKIALRKLKTEFLRIAAPILGCSFDDLYKRHQRRFIKRFIFTAAMLMTFILLFSAYVFTNASMLKKQSETIIKNQKKIENINIELDKKNSDLLKQIDKTTKQKTIADEQRKIAEDNEKEALDNLNFANIQKKLAELNASMAKQQEKIANKNKNTAEKNLRIATEQKNKLLKSQSLFLASLSNQMITKGDKTMAVLLALNGLPKNLDNPERPLVKETTDALRNAVYSCEDTFNKSTKGINYQSILKHSMLEEFCKGIDTNSIYSFSKDSIRLWDINNGRLIDELKLSMPEDILSVSYYEGNRDILVKLLDMDGVTYDLLVIKKDSDKIILADTYLKIKNLILGKDNKAICIDHKGMPIYIDYDKGVKKELKGLKNFFGSKLSDHVNLVGDISKNGNLLTVLNEIKNKVYLVALDGSIRKSFHASNLSDLFFLSDDSIISIEIYQSRVNIVKYHNGKFENIISGNDYNEYKKLGTGDSLLFIKDVNKHMEVNRIDLLNNKKNKLELDIDNVQRLRVSDDNKYAVVSDDNSNYLIDLKKLKVVRKITDCDSLIAFSPDEKYFLYYNPYSDIQPAELYETKRKENVGTLSKIMGSGIYQPVFLTNKKLVIREQDCIYVINLEIPKQEKYYFGQNWAKAYFNNKAGTSFVSNPMTGELITYNYDTGHQSSLKNAEESDDNIIMSGSYMDFSKNSRLIISYTLNGTAKPVYYKDNKSYTLNYDYKDSDLILGSSISNDGKKVMVYGRNRIIIYNAGTHKVILNISTSKEEIKGAVFSPDNTSVAVCYKNKIQYVNIESGRILKDIMVSGRAIEAVKGSLDKKIIVTYSVYNKEFSIYKGDTGKLKYKIDTDKEICDVAISGDGKTILVASYGVLSFYSSKTGKEMMQIPYQMVNDELINNCDINYNGTKALLTFAHSGYILTWDIIYDVQKLKSIGKTMIKGRTLSEEEKKEYFLIK